MKAESIWTVMATVHKDVTHTFNDVLSSWSLQPFAHSGWVVLLYSIIHAATVNESCLSVCGCAVCVPSCMCNWMCSCKAGGWHWASASIPLFFEAVLELEGGSFWTHWTGSVPFWLYQLGIKLSGSVYLCNPSTGVPDGAVMPGITWSWSLCSCWAISPCLNFTEIQTFPCSYIMSTIQGGRKWPTFSVIGFKGIFRLSSAILCWRDWEKSPWNQAWDGRGDRRAGAGPLIRL